MTLVVSTPPYQSINAQSTTQNGSVLDNGATKGLHALYVISSAGVSAGVVNLEFSADAQNWHAPASNTVTVSAPGASVPLVISCPAQFVRARISTAITGGTVIAYVASTQ